MTALAPLGRVGIWSNPLRYHPDRSLAADAAAELEDLGYGTLWLPDVGGDVIGDVAGILDATSSVAVATGILNIWMHPADRVATGFAELDRRHPGRFLLGLGASHAVVVDAVKPGSYGKPLSIMRSYLDELDAAAEPVARERRVLAALGPKMLALAVERSAGAHPYLVTAQHTRDAREAMGADAILAPEVSVVLEPDADAARATARGFIADYLALPAYADSLRRQGFGDADTAGGGSDRLVDELVAWGDEEAIGRELQAHLDAGADHVCIHVVGLPQGELARAAWRRLAPALTDMTGTYQETVYDARTGMKRPS
jgi:probable F420-dependent oxidoreductase